MKCPDCRENIHKQAEECPHCGTTLARVHQLYESIQVQVHDGIHDVAGVLNHKSRKQLRDVIQSTMRQFVGINLAVSFVSLKDEQTIENYGFWLLNAAEYNNQGIIQTGREEGLGRVILSIDVENKQAALSYGYLLDGCIRKKEHFQILSAGHASLLEGDIVHGSSLIVAALKKYLKKAVRRAKTGSRR